MHLRTRPQPKEQSQGNLRAISAAHLSHHALHVRLSSLRHQHVPRPHREGDCVGRALVPQREVPGHLSRACPHPAAEDHQRRRSIDPGKRRLSHLHVHSCGSDPERLLRQSTRRDAAQRAAERAQQPRREQPQPRDRRHRKLSARIAVRACCALQQHVSNNSKTNRVVTTGWFHHHAVVTHSPHAGWFSPGV